MNQIKVTYLADEGRYTRERVDYFICTLEDTDYEDRIFYYVTSGGNFTYDSEIYAERVIDYDEDDMDAMKAAYKELKEMFLAEAKEFGLTESNFEFWWG